MNYVVPLCRLEATLTFAAVVPPSDPSPKDVLPQGSLPRHPSTNLLSPESASQPAVHSDVAVRNDDVVHNVAVAITPPGASVHAAAVPVTTGAPEPSTGRATATAVLLTMAVVSEAVVRSALPHFTMPVTAVIERREGLEASDAPAQALGAVTLLCDLSDFLIGATEARTEVGKVELAAASAPHALCQVTFSVTCHTFEEPAEAGNPPGADTVPIPFLPRGLRDCLAPVVIRVQEIASLPDAPATRALLDAACHPCRLRMCLPGSEEWLEGALLAGLVRLTANSKVATKLFAFNGLLRHIIGQSLDPSVQQTLTQGCHQHSNATRLWVQARCIGCLVFLELEFLECLAPFETMNLPTSVCWPLFLRGIIHEV
jgi:hypothetical protein